MALLRTLILPSSHVVQARQIAGHLGDTGYWTTPLSPDGTGPATHFVSAGSVPEQFAAIMPLQIWEQDESGVWIKIASIPGNATAVHGFLQQRGVTAYSLAQITAMMAAADITEQPPFTAMARLNVQVINPPMEC